MYTQTAPYPQLSGLQPRYRDVFIDDRRGTPPDEHFFCIIASNFDTYHGSAKLSQFVTECFRTMLKSLL